MHIGEKIRSLRERRGLTLQDVGDAFSISRSSVAGWESGDSKPGIDRLPTLARLLGVSVDELLSERPITVFISHSSSDHMNWGDIIDPRKEGKLPLISDVQAGSWSDIVDNFQPGDAEDWIPCPFNHGPNAFVLRVAGQSMFNPGGEKSYAPGEFIAVDPALEPMNRRMVVARIDHEERATFKQLIIEPDGTQLLQALNPSWPNRIMPLPEGSTIVGVVIGKWTPE
jgi:SOS-response transcriptional repressor LexA